MSYENYLINNKGNAQAQLETYKQQLSGTKITSQNYGLLQSDIASYEEDIKNYDVALSDYEKGSYQKSYQTVVKIVYKDKNISSDPKSGAPADLIAAINHDYLMYQALAKRGIPYQDAEFPSSGTNYTLWVLQYLVPYVLVAGLIFILSPLFTGLFSDRLNRDLVLAGSKFYLILIPLAVGFLTSLLIFVGLISFSFIAASLLFGIGNWNYPIASNDITTHALFFQNIANLYLPSIFLEIATLIVIVQLVYLISYIVRDRVASLFISLFFIFGLSLVTPVVGGLQQIAQYLPTTYIMGVLVSDGQLSAKFNNSAVNTNFGVLVLLISIIVLLGSQFFLSIKIKRY
ncbi:MAG: hypothetical protein LBI11_00475 [Streptococcaceae bacterium]|jgi:ABC-2 type transport system permease protein|nr:hypothetical protein [Streptococcaceae bacterium]